MRQCCSLHRILTHAFPNPHFCTQGVFTDSWSGAEVEAIFAKEQVVVVDDVLRPAALQVCMRHRTCS